MTKTNQLTLGRVTLEIAICHLLPYVNDSSEVGFVLSSMTIMARVSCCFATPSTAHSEPQ